MLARFTAVRSALLIALLCLGTHACAVDTIDAVPAYPGSTPGPGYRMEEGSILQLKQVYTSGDSYLEVLAFYEEYMAADPGWEGSPGSGLAVFKNNMELGAMMASASPIDPAREGKLIVIMDEGTRTVIRAYSSHPRGEAG